MPKWSREILKFPAGFCLGFVSVWLSVRFSLDSVGVDVSPSESGAKIGSAAILISFLLWLCETALEFIKTWTNWKSHGSQIDLGKLELQLNQDQLKLECDRLQLERDRYQLDRERFEWQRTGNSTASLAQTVSHRLAGIVKPELVTFGDELVGRSKVDESLNGDVGLSEAKFDIQEK